eukprot:SAG31_NODE_1198_length_9441_cov_3.648897_9_plen_279_part_00
MLEMANADSEVPITLHLRVGATTSSEYTRPPITIAAALQFLQNVSNRVSSKVPDGALKLLLSAAQLAVQGFNRTSLPAVLRPHIGMWEASVPVFDEDTGALVSVHGLLSSVANWSAVGLQSKTLPQCAMSPNITWMQVPFGSASSVPALTADECCKVCARFNWCGAAVWTMDQRLCWMQQGLITRPVALEPCRAPRFHSYIADCNSTAMSANVAVRPARQRDHYAALVRQLLEARQDNQYVLAGANIGTIELADMIDAEYLESRALNMILKSETIDLH